MSLPADVTDAHRVPRRRRLARRAWLVPPAALAALLVAACGSSSATPAATAAASGGAGPAATVEMTNDLKFMPDTITVKAGTTVTWTNTSAVEHSVTDDPATAPDPSDAVLPSGAPTWDSGLLGADATYQVTFTVPGEYTYFCTPHAAAGMIGHVVVTP